MSKRANDRSMQTILPGYPKTPHEAETLRTPIQGQKRILDSH